MLTKYGKNGTSTCCHGYAVIVANPECSGQLLFLLAVRAVKVDQWCVALQFKEIAHYYLQQ